MYMTYKTDDEDHYVELKGKGKKLTKAKADSFVKGGYGHMGAKIVNKVPASFKGDVGEIKI